MTIIERIQAALPDHTFVFEPSTNVDVTGHPIRLITMDERPTKIRWFVEEDFKHSPLNYRVDLGSEYVVAIVDELKLELLVRSGLTYEQAWEQFYKSYEWGSKAG